MFRRVLVANRGEIACRIFRTCQRLGVSTVAVYSDADQHALHVRLADTAMRIGPAPVHASYLQTDAIVAAAHHTGAAAIHPGYGLLSERAAFAEAVRAAGMAFVGPTAEVLTQFGDKLKARHVARSVGVAPPPGSEGAIDPGDLAGLTHLAETLGYPLLVKATVGGGGIGMQRVDRSDDLAKAIRSCSDRGARAFGDGHVYLERYLQSPRHIEVQILGDSAGRCVALGERECSVQRRHQKVIEESPSPADFLQGAAGEVRRRHLFSQAVRVAESVGYQGAGTVEFVADADGNLWFLEVNARLQVEHPVTEMCTDLDLVEWQLRVAAGETFASDFAVTPHGHAIEARIYAEDPGKKFAPQPGTITHLRWPPATPQLRIETGIEQGTEITPFYDPLLAKLTAHGATRAEAIAALHTALGAVEIELTGARGPAATNVGFLREILMTPAFQSGAYDTSLVEKMLASGP